MTRQTASAQGLAAILAVVILSTSPLHAVDVEPSSVPAASTPSGDTVKRASEDSAKAPKRKHVKGKKKSAAISNPTHPASADTIKGDIK